MNNLKKNLKMLREHKSIKQEELADMFHVCKSAVSAWEVGRNEPDCDKLIELARFFEVSLDDLIAGDCLPS